MPPSPTQPPPAPTPSTWPILPIAATVALIAAIGADLYQFSVFFSLTNDAPTNILYGGAKLLFIIAALALVWTKRPGVYVLSLVAAVETVTLVFSAFVGTIAPGDALTIGALFLAVLYYKIS